VKAGNHLLGVATEAADAVWKIKRENNMKRSMSTDQVFNNQGKPGSGQEATNLQRRTVIGGTLLTLLAWPAGVKAQGKGVPNSFAVLLKGLYQPVVNGPDLGLSTVDLSIGYNTTKIYPVNGLPSSNDALTAVGDFYVQANGDLCAYDLPGGALSMRFLPQNNITTFLDGQGGSILQGTWELTVLEATGIFKGFVRGHNRMLDNLHFLVSGAVDEYCVCFVSRRP
jgi:hypothetical protein